MFDHMVKIHRARRHLKDLEAAEIEWRTFGNNRIWTENDPQDPLGRTVFFASAEEPPKYPISVIIGDWLHNWRSALDALAWELTVAGCAPNPAPNGFEKASEFPIFGDEDRNGTPGVGSSLFHKTKRDGTPAPGSGLFKTQGWQPDAQTAVEGLQPYQRGPAFREDPLWILHELDILNKHRALVTTAAWSGSVIFDPSRCRNYGGPSAAAFTSPEVYSGPVESCTEIGRLGLQPIDPNSEMHVEPQNTLFISFGKGTGAVEGERVVAKLDELHALLYLGVLPALEAFL